MLLEILVAGLIINTPHRYIVLRIYDEMTCRKMLCYEHIMEMSLESVLL
jgi:hypothetical protein